MGIASNLLRVKTNADFQCPCDNCTNLSCTQLLGHRSPRNGCIPSAMFPDPYWYLSWVVAGVILGTKFLLITEPRQPNVDTVLRRVYELYADYVMKNPFYQLEMPIRCEEFDRNLGSYAKSIP